MSAAEGTLTKDILKSFAEGIASEAGGQLGALIFGSIFPGGNPPIDIADLLNKITDIVHEQNLEFKIDGLQGKIEDVIQKVAVEYTDKKNAGFAHISPPKNNEADFKADLFTDVKDYVSAVEDVESQLATRDEFIQAAFPLYLLTVNMLLSLLQEKASVDDVDDPWNSPAVQDIKRRAADCIQKAKRVWETLQANRKAAVTVEQSDKVHFVPKGGLAGLDCWRWTDSWPNPATGDKGDKHCGFHESDAQDKANADCANQQAIVQAQLVKDMGDPDSVIALWQQCIDNPLMTRSLAKIISFKGKWTNGTTLTLSWEITGAVSATLEVSTTFHTFPTDPTSDFDQALPVELNGTRDFVTDMDNFMSATLTCTDVHGLSNATSIALGNGITLMPSG